MTRHSLIHKTLLQFLVCTALLFLFTIPLFYLLTKHFYAEDLMGVIEAVEKGAEIPPLDIDRDIMAGVMLQFIMTFMLLAIALFVTVRFVTRRLWRPFDDTLRKAEQFNLAQSDIPPFMPTDITEFSRLNDSLHRLMVKNRETYRIQKEFTENASHELQTPLAVTRSKLDLLMQEELTQQQLALVTDLYRLNTRMGHLNRNLLLLARIENSQYRRQEQIGLLQFVKGLLPSYNLLKERTKVEIDNALSNELTVEANAILLECMLNNLVVNALRNTLFGNVTISVGNGSILEVSNPASGRPLDGERIFNRFHTGSSSGRGTGLGLAIVKAICDFHGWSITYRFTDHRHVFRIGHSSTAHTLNCPT